MAVWFLRLLPWALFAPSLFWAVPQIDGDWCFILGLVNGGFASACGLAVDELKKRAAT